MKAWKGSNGSVVDMYALSLSLSRFHAQSRAFHNTGLNKKCYVMNKRKHAHDEYVHHIASPKLAMKMKMHSSASFLPHTQLAYVSAVTPTPATTNPLTSSTMRGISYLHVFGPRERTSMNLIKKGFQTSYDETEYQRNLEETLKNNIMSPQNSELNATESGLGPLKEQERLMEMDLSTSTIRHSTVHAIEHHHHLLHPEVIPFATAAKSSISLGSTHQFGGSMRAFSTFNHETVIQSKPDISSAAMNTTATSETPENLQIHLDKMDRVTHKLEDLSRELDIARNQLKEQSFDSDEAGLAAGEEKLHELDLATVAARKELKDEEQESDAASHVEISSVSSKFSAQGYDELGQDEGVDEDDEISSNPQNKS